MLQVSGSQLGDKVELEFQAFRLHQYELNGNVIGSKHFRVQYEAVSLNSKALRRCVVTSWRDLTGRHLDELLETTVGALLIIIPSDLDALSPADKTLFMELEQKLASARTDLAVYVTHSSPEANAILSDVQSASSVSKSATQQLISSIAANTFQFTSTGSPSATPLTYKPNNIIGRLSSSESSAPTIAFVTHYDSHAAFPGVAVGADSNGSGVVVLLELLAIFRKLYEKPSTRPPFNLVFVWTAAGKYNYQGTRQFIEDFQSDSSNDNRLELAICVEAVGGTGPLWMHVSKQPAEGSAAGKCLMGKTYRLLRRLRVAAPNQSVELVTKKISMNQPSAWEHEKFNIKRLPAVTLSRLSSHDSPIRKSVLDTTSRLSLDALEKNIRTIAEAVLGHMLSLPEGGYSTDPRVSADTSVLSRDAVDRQRLAHAMRLFASRPRPVADEAVTVACAANLAVAVGNYAKVTVSPVSMHEVQIWPGVSDRLLAERVKPAVFDLIIACGVFGYLALFYYVTSRAQRTLEGAMLRLRKRV
ncbi:Nicalin [Trichostrongylus colubriformis]|uniref:BOS complex subunit NCLN n=1 Tax=Trichostrongylus colubriformis TaxID=6319 RepID=A0AAN8ITF6_TRICO